MRRTQLSLKLTDEQQRSIREAVHAYILDEMGEDIGIIRQDGLINLFMEQMAPIIYNKALDDAKVWYSRRMEDAEADFWELYK